MRGGGITPPLRPPQILIHDGNLSHGEDALVVAVVDCIERLHQVGIVVQPSVESLECSAHAQPGSVGQGQFLLAHGAYGSLILSLHAPVGCHFCSVVVHSS